MTFLLDENVTERLIALLVLLGYSTTSVGRIGYKGRNDAEQMLHATRLGHVIVTYDVEDYQLLHRAWHLWSTVWNVNPKPQHAGVLAIRSAQRLTVQEVANAIDAISRSESSLASRYFEWSRQRGWEERR